MKVSRWLAVVSGPMKGQDVVELQKSLNARYKHFKIDHHVRTDGEFGPVTLSAVRQVAYMMGRGPNNGRFLKRGRVSKDVQRLIRKHRKKRPVERVATAARSKYRRQLRKRFRKSPGQVAVTWAVQQVGVTESPPNSNRGPKIDVWSAYWGLVAPQWCGVFAGYAVKKIGGAKVTSWLPYAPSITNDARANRNGLKAVPFSSARAGDLATFWGGSHIGLVKKVEGDRLYTVEGNTSSGTTGSQSNGGGVFERVRSRSDVDVIARPDYR